eukprot:6231908-Prymnesium_polylepis.1
MTECSVVASSASTSLHNSKHAVVEGLSVNTPSGRTLLDDTRLAVVPNRRYAVVGPNGSGKSTLLHAIASGALPSWPRSLRTMLVRQEVVAGTASLLQSLFDARGAAYDRTDLEAERDSLELQLEESDAAVERTAERLADIYVRLDTIDGPEAEREALTILRGLQFSPDGMSRPASSLSGGWQQRLALAQALFVQPD